MDWVENLKKYLVMGLIGVILLLSIIVTISVGIRNYKKKKIEIGTNLYEKVHNLYFFNEGLKYELEEDKYQLLNYEEIEKIISKDYLEKTTAYLGITKEEGKYYINITGKGYTNYYGTQLKIKKIRKKKMIFKAVTTMCESNAVVTYGEGCKKGGYYTIEKPFIIVKEDGKWKVSEYTSIFQFTDRELK